ncbi:C40 family peptidase [Desulfonatronovibrio hydrogenovorans]|uniref:C40 family peptidase n=1 Tax=Desulfonatronovibrio hydrogenovorans TaxID=53245 RepID=UPI000A02CF49
MKILWPWVLLLPLLFWGCHSSSPAQASDLCQDIQEAWLTIEGTPYVWGGNSFAAGGFDCSGAIFKVSKLIGRPVPRTTSQRYYLSTPGPDQHWSEAKCGYVVWWTLQPSRPYGHLGMHIEQPEFWHSGSSTGPTKATHWRGSYWDRHFEASKLFYR